MDRLKTRAPINKTAALVVSKGTEFVPMKRVLTMDSPNPIPTIGTGRLPYNIAKVVQGYIGKRRGRLVVVGLYSHQPMRYVMRCQCGTYTVRKSKTLRNEANYDMCEHCRHLMQLKRSEHWRRTGRDITWQELDGVE